MLLILFLVVIIVIIVIVQAKRPDIVKINNYKKIFQQNKYFDNNWTRVFLKLKFYSPEDLFLKEKYKGPRPYKFISLLYTLNENLDELVDTCKNYETVEVTSNLIAIPLLAGAIPILKGPIPYGINPDCIKQHNVKVIDKKVFKNLVPWYYGTDLTTSYKPILWWNSFGSDYIVINLDRHKDRLQKIASQFESSSRTFCRFPAIDGSKYIKQYDIKWKVLVPLTAGRLGILLSVHEICHSLIREPSEIDYYAVLEDDIVFKGEIPDPFEIVKTAPRDWWMLFLGVNKYLCLKTKQGAWSKLNQKCMPGGFAYIIRKRMAQFLVNHFEPIEVPSDNIFQYMSNFVPIYSSNVDYLSVDYCVESSTETF